MDFIKKAAGDALNKNKEGGSNENKEQQNNSQDVGKQDYLDKGVGFISNKAGYKMDRNTEEKVSDGMRNAYEKASGKKVPEKFSN